MDTGCAHVGADSPLAGSPGWMFHMRGEESPPPSGTLAWTADKEAGTGQRARKWKAWRCTGCVEGLGCRAGCGGRWPMRGQGDVERVALLWGSAGVKSLLGCLGSGWDWSSDTWVRCGNGSLGRVVSMGGVLLCWGARLV